MSKGKKPDNFTNGVKIHEIYNIRYWYFSSSMILILFLFLINIIHNENITKLTCITFL